MVEEVEAAVNPYPSFGDGNVFLRIDGPLTRLGNDASHVRVDVRCHGG